MNVFFLPEVFKYFEEVALILYERGYFGFKETAERYTIELVNDIKINLPTKVHKSAPEHFDKYGKNMKYAGFKKNKNTTWYAFFTTYQKNRETIYLVRYIANNHTIAQHL
jgi:hypothetical protein